MKTFADRIKSVEAVLGANLPASYCAFLSRPYSQPGKSVGVPFRGELWDVEEFLRLDNSVDYFQLDSTFERVHNALPPNTLPFARDLAGNFFCIVVAGDRNGRVVWWDREREIGDNHVEDVADSLDDFMRALTEFSDDNA